SPTTSGAANGQSTICTGVCVRSLSHPCTVCVAQYNLSTSTSGSSPVSHGLSLESTAKLVCVSYQLIVAVASGVGTDTSTVSGVDIIPICPCVTGAGVNCTVISCVLLFTQPLPSV